MPLPDVYLRYALLWPSAPTYHNHWCTVLLVQYDIYRPLCLDDVYKQRLIGYRYTHSTKIEFDSDNERLGKILYALAHSSLEPKFRLSYTVKDPEAVKNNLLSRAVKDAKEKAKILTAAADVELGEILSIDYSWREITFEEHPLQLIEDKMLCSEPMASYNLDIEPDDISASDTVTIIWKIKQK